MIGGSYALTLAIVACHIACFLAFQHQLFLFKDGNTVFKLTI